MAYLHSDNNALTHAEHMQLLMNYYSDKNIDNYKKTSKGLPDMRNKENQSLLVILVKNTILNRNNQDNKHCAGIIEEDYRKDILNLSEKDIHMIRSIQTETCSICYESIKTSHAHLECGHLFCPSCIIQHGRNKNDCPMCRATIRDVPLPPNNRYRSGIQLQPLSNGIIDYIMNQPFYHYRDEEFNFKKYLEFQFEYYHKDKDKFVSEMIKGIDHLLRKQINHIEHII